MAAASDQRTITYSRVVDLSYTISPDMPRWPGDPAPAFEEVATLEADGYYLRRFSLGEHSGTHLNAPRAFRPQGAGVDGYSPDTLLLPAVVLDASEAARGNADYALTPDDVARWESRYGSVPPGCMVLLCTGWHSRWGSPGEFLGLDARGGLHYPGFGLDAARLLVEERGVGGLGVDTPGAEPGQDGGFGVNHLALGHSRVVLECLANLDRLPPTGATLVIGVLKLQDGSGSPASVLALVP